MQTNDILKAIDDQIAQLQKARALLTSKTTTTQPTGKKRGRPKGSGSKASEADPSIAKKPAKLEKESKAPAKTAASPKPKAIKKTESPTRKTPSEKKVATKSVSPAPPPQPEE